MKYSTQKGSPASVPETKYDPALTNTPVLVNDSPCNLCSFLLENENTSAVFVQFFDAASTGSIVPGTTVPDWTLMIPAESVWGRDVEDDDLRHFYHGIVVCVTTTRDGGAAPSANVKADFWFNRQ